MSGSGKDKSRKSAATGSSNTQRIDKWLWFSRIVKTRSLATRLVVAGKVRINRIKCTKPSQSVQIDDVVTAAIGPNIRVLKVLAPGVRRGPAPQARLLYEDLAPPEKRSTSSKDDLGLIIPAGGVREPGSGRPTKRERRQMDRLRSWQA